MNDPSFNPAAVVGSGQQSLVDFLSASPLSPVERNSLSDLGKLDAWLKAGITPNPCFASKRAVIIGGSFAGLTTACTLHRLGMQVGVFDRVASLREGGAGIGIEDTSLACLAALGFGDQLRSGPTLPLRQQIHRTNNREFFRSPYPYVSCYWNDVYQIIYSALPDGMVNFGQNFIGYKEREDGKLVVSFEGGREEICDLLLGCDGPTSSVRRSLHPGSMPGYRGYTAWRGYLDKDLAKPEIVARLYEYYDCLAQGAIYFHVGSRESGHLVVYELPASNDSGRKINFLWYVERQNFGEQLGSGKDVGRDQRITRAAKEEELGAMHAAAQKYWPEAVAAYIAAVPDPFMNDIYDMDPIDDQWGRGAVTLVGDAAHATTPHLLKSSNMAICDAMELALRLSNAEDVPSALRAYEAFRAPVTRRTMAISRQLGMVRQGLAEGAPQCAEEWEAMSTEDFQRLMGDGREPVQSARV